MVSSKMSINTNNTNNNIVKDKKLDKKLGENNSDYQSLNSVFNNRHKNQGWAGNFVDWIQTLFDADSSSNAIEKSLKSLKNHKISANVVKTQIEKYMNSQSRGVGIIAEVAADAAITAEVFTGVLFAPVTGFGSLIAECATAGTTYAGVKALVKGTNTIGTNRDGAKESFDTTSKDFITGVTIPLCGVFGSTGSKLMGVVTTNKVITTSANLIPSIGASVFLSGLLTEPPTAHSNVNNQKRSVLLTKPENQPLLISNKLIRK